jgi:hypothetical protein|uniref:Uncharacterized protein n=1 Tax=Panagrolaimus sp. PS1159 TaxID=55785 RepID=A0AC35GQP7_9BILA
MSLLDQELEPTNDVFVARCDSPGNMHYVLKALEFKEKPKLFCTVNVSNEGMKFIVESHKNFQGIAYLCRGMFSEWDLQVQQIEFRIGLVDFMESVNCIKAKTATVTLSMKDEKKDVKDRRLYIHVVDRKVRADIALPVYNPNTEFVDFMFQEAEVRAKLMVEAKTIKKIFQEIDPKENPCVTFTFNPDECFITINSETLKSTARFPKFSSEVLEIFCDGDSLAFDYKSMFIKRFKYATNNSSKISLTMNDNGVLSAQFMFAKVERTAACLEFFINPFEDVAQL